MRCTGLHEVANPPYLSRFPFSAPGCPVLPRIALPVVSREAYLLDDLGRAWHTPEVCPAPRETIGIPAYPSPLLLLNADVGPPHLRRDEPIPLALFIHAGPHQPKTFELLSELLLTGIRHGTSASPSPKCRAWWIAPQRG